MKKTRTVVAALTALSLPSCSTYMDLAKLPRNDTAAIAAATEAAAKTPDLDLDGTVNGAIEWEAFIRTWVQAYQASKK